MMLLNPVLWLAPLLKSSGCVLFSRTWESLFFLSIQFTVIIISLLSLFTIMSSMNGQKIMRLIDTSTIIIIIFFFKFFSQFNLSLLINSLSTVSPCPFLLVACACFSPNSSQSLHLSYRIWEKYQIFQGPWQACCKAQACKTSNLVLL